MPNFTKLDAAIATDRSRAEADQKRREDEAKAKAFRDEQLRHKRAIWVSTTATAVQNGANAVMDHLARSGSKVLLAHAQVTKSNTLGFRLHRSGNVDTIAAMTIGLRDDGLVHADTSRAQRTSFVSVELGEATTDWAADVVAEWIAREFANIEAGFR